MCVCVWLNLPKLGETKIVANNFKAETPYKWSFLSSSFKNWTMKSHFGMLTKLSSHLATKKYVHVSMYFMQTPKIILITGNTNWYICSKVKEKLFVGVTERKTRTSQCTLYCRAWSQNINGCMCSLVFFVQSANSLRKNPLIQLLKIIAAVHGHLQRENIL